MNQDEKKKAAAERALEYVQDGIALGVGTGSTVNFFIDLLIREKPDLTDVVSSSEASTARLAAGGIAVTDLNGAGDLDLYVDGADEANKHRQLIKGGGGALTREKIVAAASRKFVCIVDDSKLVGLLGEFPLPVEVIPMAQSYVARQLIKSGGQPILRPNFTTDNGNIILDVHNLKLTNPVEIEHRLNQIAGVVSVGLFAARPADLLIVSSDDGIRIIE